MDNHDITSIMNATMAKIKELVDTIFFFRQGKRHRTGYLQVLFFRNKSIQFFEFFFCELVLFLFIVVEFLPGIPGG